MSEAIARLQQLQGEWDRLSTFVSQGQRSAQLDERLRALAVQLREAKKAAVPQLLQRQDFAAVNNREVAGNSGGASGGTLARGGARTPGLKASPGDVDVIIELRMPSVPTSLVRLFAMAGKPLVSVRLLNRGDRARRVSVATRVEGFSALAIETVTCLPNEHQAIDHFPTFFPEEVARLDEFCVASLSVEVTDVESGAGIWRRTVPIRLLARQTAVLFQLDPREGVYVDLRHTLGAWITPNARSVLELLRTAADFSNLHAMSGYQVDEAGVLEHVRAIYEALKAAEIVYINSVDAFGGVDGQFLQRVRTPTESLACKSANCIDGTVLMASLLEATGIEAGIVLVPGHAYLAWLKRKPPEQEGLAPELNDPKAHLDLWECLETTMIGSGTFEQAREHARDATSRFVEADLLELMSVAKLRKDNVTPLE